MIVYLQTDPDTIKLGYGEHIWVANDDLTFCIVDKICRPAGTPLQLQRECFSRTQGLGYYTRFRVNYHEHKQKAPTRLRSRKLS